MSYNLADQLTGYQKQVIRQTIKKQEIKKAKSKHPDIYENHIDEPEFWDELATQIATKLFQNSSNYYESYELQSKGNLDGKGFRIELLDSYNNEKFFIDYTGDIGPAEKYTAPKGLGIDGFDIFLLVMIPVYFVAFLVACNFADDTLIPVAVVIVLGIINLFMVFG